MERSHDTEEEPSEAEPLGAAARAQGQKLRAGRGVTLFGGALSHRILLAAGIFVVVFLIVWLAFWGLAGGVGLGLGWLPATTIGIAAVWKLANRFETPDRGPSTPR